MRRWSILIQYRRATGRLDDAHFVVQDAEDAKQAQQEAMTRALEQKLQGPLSIVRCSEVAA